MAETIRQPNRLILDRETTVGDILQITLRGKTRVLLAIKGRSKLSQQGHIHPVANFIQSTKDGGDHSFLPVVVIGALDDDGRLYYNQLIEGLRLVVNASPSLPNNGRIETDIVETFDRIRLR